VLESGAGGDLQVADVLFPEQELAALVLPSRPGERLTEMAMHRRDAVEAALTRYGAVLFRGFALAGAADFQAFMTAVAGNVLPYVERSSPRRQVEDRVYTSTEHPAEEAIFLHNEQSYNAIFPQKIAFFCVKSAAAGGETPIASCRRVFDRIPRSLRDALLTRRYRYVRTYHKNVGVSWETAFQTTHRGEVEAYCRANDIGLEWLDRGRLRTWQVRDVALRHPRSGDATWMNHLTFFHPSTLRPEVRAFLAQLCGADGLPSQTHYGDGEPFEPDVLATLREAYAAETCAFPWREGDVLLLDNSLTAHGRSPFRGPRVVWTAMGQPCRWADVALPSSGSGAA
jgi:alpha-ketoglutarate-dependent taurine dioxygenase